ncbi:MAG TPA: hypothetical protein VN706_16015 [Gemmatimonadaceae bacterium]|nr:hypothetical protein [Gemmatimonadaceae bacterium]
MQQQQRQQQLPHSNAGGGMRIVIGFAYLLAVLTAIDLVSTWVRDHRVRYVSLILCVGFLAAATLQLWQLRRTRG